MVEKNGDLAFYARILNRVFLLVFSFYGYSAASEGGFHPTLYETFIDAY